MLKLQYVFIFIFYLILIGICIKTYVTFIKEPTAYEETTSDSKAKMPSFTLCPLEHRDSIVKSIENFDDITKAIENAKSKYTVTIQSYKPFEKVQTTKEMFNDTSNNVWYYAPKTSVDYPFDTVICLIWTPSSLQHKLKQYWNVAVCINKYFLIKTNENTFTASVYPFTVPFKKTSFFDTL